MFFPCYYGILKNPIQTLTMETEYDYEDEISSILSSARAQASVSLAGKLGSRRHSTTSFSENVIMAETSYQMLKVLSFCDRERA